MKRIVLALAAIAALSEPAWAQVSALASMELATNIGNVLGSEEFCGLTFDQDAIQAYINKKVKADDMSFPNMLDLAVDAEKMSVEDYSASQKTAHCTQIGRIAKNYGFIK